MLATHQDAEQRYEQLRKTALEIAQETASAGIRFRLINAQALTAACSWEDAPGRAVDWQWFAGYADFKFRHPKRFEVALWERGSLIGLSLGRPTYHGNHLRLDFVEARPAALGPRSPVFGSIDVAYEVYAGLLNARQIRIMNPINTIVRNYYRTFGYEYVAKKNYLFREL